MKFSIHKNSKSGVALIMVMIAIAAFSSMVAMLALSMKVETHLAMRSDNEEQLLWLGRSGVERARWILAQEATIAGEPYDSLNQIWAGGPGGPGETNSVLAGISLDNYHVGGGTVSIKITDLERFINVNTADSQLLQQVLTAMGADADDISVVSDSIQDWIDSDDAPRVAGAENDYYQSLTPPYYAKNAPIDDLSELLLIKGVTPEMYWGPNSTNNPASQRPRRPKLGFGNAPGQAPDYSFGLKDIFTPISSGRININTAGTNVLQMIPGVDAAIAETIVEQRAGPDGVDGTEDDVPFRSVGQLASAGVNPRVIGQLTRFCDTRSHTFRVHVRARIGDSTRDFYAILFRNSPMDIRILSFYWR
ncbi:MAG: general secretion pathway protein GspK [Limisphaerales bacterium]